MYQGCELVVILISIICLNEETSLQRTAQRFTDLPHSM